MSEKEQLETLFSQFAEEFGKLKEFKGVFEGLQGKEPGVDLLKTLQSLLDKEESVQANEGAEKMLQEIQEDIKAIEQ